MNHIQIALMIMVKGMAGIFAVTLVILLLVWLLGKAGTRNSSEEIRKGSTDIQGKRNRSRE